MLLTSNEEWATKARYLTTQSKDDPVEYVHGEIGYNYRLTNVQAAMGCAQMEQLDSYIAAKRRIASVYTGALREIPGVTPMPAAAWANPTFWMYTVLIDPAKYGMDSRSLLKGLAEQCIQSRPLWQPMHRSRAHAGAQATEPERIAKNGFRALSLPCSVGLTESEQDRVIDAIRNLH